MQGGCAVAKQESVISADPPYLATDIEAGPRSCGERNISRTTVPVRGGRCEPRAENQSTERSSRYSSEHDPQSPADTTTLQAMPRGPRAFRSKAFSLVAKSDWSAVMHLQLQPDAATQERRFFFSSRRRHTILTCDWSSDVCS